MWRLVVCVLCAGAMIQSQQEGDGRQPAYPAEEWSIVAPHEVGLDADLLRQFAELVGGRGCVVRHGRMAYAWGDISRRGDVASAAKPVYAHFIINAVEQGLIESFDAPVQALEPRLAALNSDLGHKDREITWRHMAHQTSCYGVAERPGEAFNYNDYHMALLVDTLFNGAYGVSLDSVDQAVLQPLLTDVLQCQDSPTLLAFGPEDRPGRLAISPRDFARFGLLYLREGLWRDHQVISREHALMVRAEPVPPEVPQSTGAEAEMIEGQRSHGSRQIPDNQCDHLGSYSWLWWINGVDRDGRRHWPDAPRDAFGAFGHGGPRAMVVLPSLDMVVSWNDAAIDTPEEENQALALLAAAADVSASDTAVAQPPLWLRHPNGEPLFMCGPGDPEGFLYRGDLRPDGTRDGDQMELINTLAATGANCIYLMGIRSHGGDGEATHNPFVDHDPSMPLNEAVLDQWHTWFQAMDDAGIVIYFFLYDDGVRIWDTGDEVGEQELAYIRGVVERFQHHHHLVWCVAEEAEEALSPERIRRVAAEIKRWDRWGHPVAVHLNHGIDFTPYADDPNIDQFAVQYNVPTPEDLHSGMVEAWRRARGRYGLNMSECSGHGTGEHARHMSWACAMAGAHVMILSMDIAGTAVSDMQDCGRIIEFMEAAQFSGMSPHDELALADAEWVLAEPGVRCAAYTRNGSRLGVAGFCDRPCDLLWFDPVTGQSLRQEAVTGQGEPLVWQVPEGIGPEVAVSAVVRG